MKTKAIQITLYPTPAPAAEEVLYETDSVSEIVFVCERLFLEEWPLEAYDTNQVHTHFLSLAEIMSFEHHLVIETMGSELDWKAVLQELAQLLPQFAWIRCRTGERMYGRKMYYVDFVPIALRQEGFPFDLNITRSIVQQLGYKPETASQKLCNLLEQQLMKHQQEFFSKEKLRLETPLQEKRQSAAEKTIHAEHQLLVYQEEIKRDKYAKERLRIANEKLELMMEKLELAMMYGGVLHLESSDEEDAEWDKRLKISLREYSYLLQKAKYLEQVWTLNGELVTKSERMTVSGNQLIYERDQIKRIKDTISSSEIYLVMDECKLIESRAVIKVRPWFQKPYVKLMKMDYDSLLNKSAYFDLLQGESYIMEKLCQDSQKD